MNQQRIRTNGCLTPSKTSHIGDVPDDAHAIDDDYAAVDDDFKSKLIDHDRVSLGPSRSQFF